MIRRALPLALAAALLLAAPGTLQAQGASPADETAVRALVAQYQAAREKGDATALTMLFTADADQLVSSGEWRRGRDAVVKGSLASSQQTAGTRTLTIETVRTVGSGVAIADSRYDITQNDGSVRRMWASWLVVKDGAAWKIAAIRNMLPATPATAPAR